MSNVIILCPPPRFFIAPISDGGGCWAIFAGGRYARIIETHFSFDDAKRRLDEMEQAS
jgi:hypothetical protein